MNCHALTPPIKYKKSVIIGMIHNIFRTCSTYKHFHKTLQKDHGIFWKIDRLIRDTLTKIFEKKKPVAESEEVEEEEEKKMWWSGIVGKYLISFKIYWIKWIIFAPKKLTPFYRPLDHLLISPWRVELFTKLSVYKWHWFRFIWNLVGTPLPLNG